MDDIDHSEKRHFLSFPRLLLLLLIIVGGFTIYTRFSFTQHSKSEQASSEVFDVRLENLDNTVQLYGKRLDEIDHKLAKLSQAAPATQASLPGNAEARIAALEKQISSLSSAPKMEGNEQVYQAIRLLSAFHRLSNKVVAGKPFAAELSAFEEQDPDEAKSEPITTLAPYADNGVPTFAILLASFDAALDQLNAAQSVAPADASFWERFVYNLKHMISIRKIDPTGTEKSVDAIIARAQSHLEREEIEAAMAEIKTLPDDARSNFSVWLEDAQMAAEMPSLMDQIEEQVMQTAFHAKPSAAGQEQKQ